jgi:hypothetical protein
MKHLFSAGALAAVFLFALASCSTQEEMAPKPAAVPAPAAKAEAKAPAEKSARRKGAEKAKATKLAAMSVCSTQRRTTCILVTKEGKLVTIDFDAKFQPTQKDYEPAKVADIGLGSSATVQYTKEGEKNLASNIEFVPAKGE